MASLAKRLSSSSRVGEDEDDDDEEKTTANSQEVSAHVAKKGLVLQASPVKEAAFTASASVRKGLKPLMPPGVSSS